MAYNCKLCPRYLLSFHLIRKHLATGEDLYCIYILVLACLTDTQGRN